MARPTVLETLQERGIRRLGTPKQGFRYVSSQGRSISAAERERIQALKIPPAWTNVFVDPSPRARVVAIGKDRAGRWQYRYAESFRARRDVEKYERLMRFAEALPKMRRVVERDLSRRGLGRDKVMACVLRILSTCFVRPGSAAYAAENGSYGLATLRAKHVKVRGDTVTFDYRGKAGKQQHRELTDRRVARIVRQLLKTPGIEVFKYLADDGEIIDVRRRHINEYIKQVMGEHFSAKDFRTWAGTLICACALARAGVKADEPARARKKKVVQAVKETAEHLGNTPAICKASYIYPSVLSQFDRGRVIDRYFHDVEELVEHTRPDFHASEKALLDLLRKNARPAA